LVSRREWRWAAVWAMVLTALASLPYLVGYLATPRDLFYTGFLTNPLDGHSYLSKVRQGFDGAWLWHLAFTPERHEGGFLLTYYLLLGHVARWTGIAPILILHLARVLNGYGLLLVLYYAISWLFDDIVQRRFAFLLSAIGSGLGWIAIALGTMTADLWVPEGYVFYSLLSNAHFPLSIALTVLVVTWSVTPWNAARVRWARVGGVALCAALLGILQPFCLITAGSSLLLYAIWQWLRQKGLPWHQIVSGASIAAFGFPFALNAYLAVKNDALLAGWSTQNQTPSPPFWDLLSSYGLIVLLALLGAWYAVRHRRGRDWFLLGWVASIVLLMYLPLSLQRRMIMGLVIPLGALATVGWNLLPARRRLRASIVLGLASLTHLLLIGMSTVMLFSHPPLVYMTRDERAAMRWLEQDAPHDALVAAAPETGLFIPAWAGQRVFYGHPFETAQAVQREAEVRAFFAKGDLLALPYRPDYVFYGDRERTLQVVSWSPDARWQAVYGNQTVTVYAVPKE
jgi:hypothetical protein